MSGSETGDLSGSDGPVLVTGATGYLGSQLARKLSRDGHQVRILHRAHSDLSPLHGVPVAREVGDLYDPQSLDRACRGARAVFHCAAQVAGWRQLEPMVDSHVRGTRNLLRAALRSRVPRVIHVSSVASLGVPRWSVTDPAGGMTEAHVWNWRRCGWPYGYAKALAEIEVWQAVASGLDAVIVCPSVVIGPGDFKRLRDGLFNMTVTGRALPFSTRGGLNTVDLRRALAGIVSAWHHGQTGRRYLLTAHNLTYTEFLTALATAAGVRPPRFELPAAAMRQLGRLICRFPALLRLMPTGGMLSMAGLHFYYDSRASEANLQLPPAQPLAQMLASTVAWTRQQLGLNGPNN